MIGEQRPIALSAILGLFVPCHPAGITFSSFSAILICTHLPFLPNSWFLCCANSFASFLHASPSVFSVLPVALLSSCQFLYSPLLISCFICSWKFRTNVQGAFSHVPQMWNLVLVEETEQLQWHQGRWALSLLASGAWVWCAAFWILMTARIKLQLPQHSSNKPT